MLSIITQSSDKINQISFLSLKDSELLSLSSSREYFFGEQDTDLISVGIFDSQKQLISSGEITGSSSNLKVYYDYEDVDGNIFKDYYFPIKSNLIQDLNKNILISIEDIIDSQSVTNNNFYLSITPTSPFFSQKNPLIIKEISNSRKEIKFIKNFADESVINDISVTFNGNQILLNGNQEIKIKKGTVYNLNFTNQDINIVRFSKTKDGKFFSGGSDYVKNILYKQSTKQIILDATEDIPNTLFVYNRNFKDNNAIIQFEGEVDSKIFKLNTEFLALEQKSFINKKLCSEFEYYLNSFSLSEIFSRTKDNYETEINSLKFLFSLVDDDGVMGILRSIYYGESYYDATLRKQKKLLGIKDYIINYLKFNYEFINTFDYTRTIFSNINNFTCNKRLLFFNQNVNISKQSKQQYVDSFRYVSTIMSEFLTYVINSIELQYLSKFKSPLKNTIKFKENELFFILNSKIQNDEFLVKLKDPIPDNYNAGDFCEISNNSYTPFFQIINFETDSIKSTIKLTRPNFNIDINEPSTRTIGSQYFNNNELKLNRIDNNKINTVKKIKNVNVDYTNFSNFVVFSSANLRIKIFQNKIIKETLLDEENQKLKSLDSSGSSVNDKFNVHKKIEDNNKEIDEIYSGFDGYESYLYNTNKFIYNSTLKKFTESKTNKSSSDFVDQLLNDSTYYDKNNRDSLINNTPEYVYLNENNDEYLKFLSMIGHTFDNIYLYISSIGIYKKVGEDYSTGISSDFINHILSSFGFDTPPSVSGILENASIEECYLDKFKKVDLKNSISLDKKTKIIWKRVLNNLPSIYKTKGTEECLRQIFSIYGIPNNMILVKEFGGGYTKNEISSSYLVDEKEYLLEFVGGDDEYVEIKNLTPYKSIDFKLFIDKEKYKNLNRLIVPIHGTFNDLGEPVYSLGFIKFTEKLGSLYFVIKNKNFLPVVYITSPFYMFNGEVMNILLRKNEASKKFEHPIDENILPIQYDIVIHQNEFCVDPIDKKFSFYLSGSYNEKFNGLGGITAFGNPNEKIDLISELGNIPIVSREAILQGVISESFGNVGDITDLTTEFDYNDLFRFTELQQYSLSNFYGCLDKITIQKTPISDENFYIKCKNFNSYYQGQPSSSYDDILFRFNLGVPIDIISGSFLEDGYKVNNVNPRYNNIYAAVHNVVGNNYYNRFNTSSCVSESYSIFPHQTREFNIRNEYFTAEIGPSRFENDKVNKSVRYTYDGTLSPLKSQTYKNKNEYYVDTNKIGVFLSPIHERNKSILDFFGNYEIVSSISDPRERFGRKYLGLEKLREYYYGENYINKILFNELFTIYKTYVDGSIFDTLKNLLPARNKVYTGLLIEPTILERNRIEEKPVNITNLHVLTASIQLSNILGDVDSSTISYLTNSIVDLKLYKNSFVFGDYSFEGYKSITDVPDLYMNNIFVDHNGLVDVDGKKYFAYSKINKKTVTYSSDNITSSNVTKDFISVELINSGSSFTTSSAHNILSDLRNFPHISRKNLSLRKELYYVTGSLDDVDLPPSYFGKGRQNRFTTINESGNDNREPIIRIDTSQAVIGTPLTSSISRLQLLPWFGNLRKLPRFASPYRGAVIDIETKNRFNTAELYISSGEIISNRSQLILENSTTTIKQYTKYRIPEDFQPNVLFGGRGL